MAGSLPPRLLLLLEAFLAHVVQLEGSSEVFGRKNRVFELIYSKSQAHIKKHFKLPN